MEHKTKGCILFDWGDTLMRDNKNFTTAMKDWPEVEAIPGAAEILPALHTNWILAIATNAELSNEKDIRAALLRVNLNQWLDKIYCIKTIGYAKPSLEFYRYILKDLGLSPKSTFMVGDNFEADVLGANRCGIRSVWFNSLDHENRQAAMVQTIHKLIDLPAVLAAWDTD